MLPAATLTVLVVLWEVSCPLFAIPDFLLPAPSAIWQATAAAADHVVVHTAHTALTITYGFFAAIALSLPIAIFITASPLISAAVYPLLVLIQSIPKVALAPILVVMLGTGEMPRVIITFLVAFFPLVISTATGLQATPKELLELARSLKASRTQELFSVRLPCAVPFIFSGLKVAATLSAIGAVVAEFVASQSGLGYQLISATAFFNTPLAFGAMLLLSLLAIIAFQLVVVIERIFFPWAISEEAKK